MGKYKSIFAVMLIFLMIGFSTVPRVIVGGAEGNGDKSGQQVGNTSNVVQADARKQEYERVRERVQVNNQQMLRLKEKILMSCEELKLRIQDRLQDRERISDKEMERYQEMNRLIQSYTERLRTEYQGRLREQVALMQQARVHGDVEEAIKVMNELQTRQQTRLQMATKILESLNSLQKDFN